MPEGRSGGVHRRRFSAQQLVSVGALLIALAAAPARAADDIHFDPAITAEEFHEFSMVAGQAIFPTPVEPARAGGLLRFDVGVAANLVKVDTHSSWWQHAVPHDISTSGYVAVPRLTASKGFSFVTVSGTYGKIANSNAKLWGGAVDVPIIDGSVVRPGLAVRAAYSTLDGVDVYKLKTYGAELFLSKGFGPLTPYGAIGRMRTDARGTIPASGATPEYDLSDRASFNRYTLGLRISMLVPKFVVEVTQAHVRSYAAKVSLGF